MADLKTNLLGFSMNSPITVSYTHLPAEVVRINNKAIVPSDDLDQQDLPDVTAQRLTELDRRISAIERAAQGDIPPVSYTHLQWRSWWPPWRWDSLWPWKPVRKSGTHGG